MKCSKDTVLRHADLFMAVYVVFPLVVTFWRGTWDLWDIYSVIDCRNHSNNTDPDIPCAEVTGNWVSAGIGMVVCALINCVSDKLTSAVQSSSSNVCCLWSRVVMYIYGLAFLGQWRGVWNLLNAYTDLTWQTNLAHMGVAVAIAAVLRVNKAWGPPPWDVGLDTDKENVFVSTPWFRSNPGDSRWRYCVDQALSQLIVVNLVIAIWRGVWNSLADGIFPDNYVLSSAISLAGGNLVLFLVYPFTSTLHQYLRNLPPGSAVRQTVVESAYFVLMSTALVSMWRGLWDLEVAFFSHFLPHKLTDSWLCHSAGGVCLMLMLTFRSTYDNSVCLDGEIDGNRTVIPNMRLLQTYASIHKQRVQARQTCNNNNTVAESEYKNSTDGTTTADEGSRL